jgi:hypothetical protein
MPNTSSHEQERKKPEGEFTVERRESQEGGGEPGSLGGGKICFFPVLNITPRSRENDVGLG